MNNKNRNIITSESLSEQIEKLVAEDKESPGAWNYFILCTIKDLKHDYDVTTKYLSNINKEQFDFVCEGIEEVVYHFQKIEMVELVESLYHKFYGESTDTEFYRDNIEGLRNCIKNK